MSAGHCLMVRCKLTPIGIRWSTINWFLSVFNSNMDNNGNMGRLAVSISGFLRGGLVQFSVRELYWS